MKKKVIILSILFIVFFILINIFYDFFYGDNASLLDKILFRKKYYSREIVECNVDYNNPEGTISKNNITVKLVSLKYEEGSGELEAEFDFNVEDGTRLRELRAMLRVHDNQEIFYNSSIGDMLFLGETDYVLYNSNLYSRLSTKNFGIAKQNTTDFNFSTMYDKKNLKLNLKLGKNYEVLGNLYIEFLDVIYMTDSYYCYKPMYPLGEYKFIINF